MKKLLLGAALLLAACTTPSGMPLTPQQKQETALYTLCKTYNSTLYSLSVLNLQGKLTQGDVDAVNQSRAVLNPVCRNPLQNFGEDVMTVLREYLQQMVLIEAEKSK